MANTEVINYIIQTTGQLVVYMLPILGILTGLVFCLSLLYQWTFGSAKSIR